MSRTAQEKLDRYYNSPDRVNDIRRLALRKSCLTREGRILLYEEELVYLRNRFNVVLRRLNKLKEEISDETT